MTNLWPDVPASLFGTDARFPMQSAHVGYVLERRDVYAYRVSDLFEAREFGRSAGVG